MASASPTMTDQRRFTSILIVHPEIREPATLAALIGARIEPVAASEAAGTPLGVERVEYVTQTNYYPDSVGDKEERRQPGGYPHQLYVARVRAGVSGVDAVMLASPYVRLLHRIVNELGRRIRGPALQFITLDMPAIYRAFARHTEGLVATKVTLQMLSQPGLELVSLTGRNPLDSELHEQIKEVAAPYALRAEVFAGEQRVRVNVDRHGNLWWYQTDEAKLAGVLKLIGLLSNIDSMRVSRTIPLERAEPDDESP